MTALRTDDPALLGRPELVHDFEAALEALAGQSVLVTGAAGSIGRMLARTLIATPGLRLTLLDHHEHSLFELQRSLSEVDPCRGRFVLADVRDTARMARVLRASRPDVIFHLAAYKHVHFGEQFPEETVRVNVVATRELLRLAAEAGVARFVYPSSDKAVNPPSLYGATKRLSEVLVYAAARHGHAWAALRYMNVLGTRGSVLETFAAQLEAGQPLTVTDAAMTRYWISQREAIWLALQAAQTEAGSLLMLDVREEVPVVEMASRLAGQLGARGAAYPMVFTGARPGERLREQVLGPHEHLAPGPVPGVVRVVDERREQHEARVEALVDELAELCDAGSADELRAATMRAAHALQ